ncbi:MAG: hypothetical protein KF763_12345 [Cyclobacteriaceae bacterium]|nr:hypothetical protein [Cyclobacteriaceae bacterium]
MKRVINIALLLVASLSIACEDKGSPDDMDECTLQDGTKICVPKGRC